jgi:hypothetical protein
MSAMRAAILGGRQPTPDARVAAPSVTVSVRAQADFPWSPANMRSSEPKTDLGGSKAKMPSGGRNQVFPKPVACECRPTVRLSTKIAELYAVDLRADGDCGTTRVAALSRPVRHAPPPGWSGPCRRPGRSTESSGDQRFGGDRCRTPRRRPEGKAESETGLHAAESRGSGPRRPDEEQAVAARHMDLIPRLSRLLEIEAATSG